MKSSQYKVDTIPSPINFHDPKAARRWAGEANRKRPARKEFFKRLSSELSIGFDRPVTILDIGSGHGFLAEHLLLCCDVQSYTMLDFSEAMHDLARRRLESFKDMTTFLIRNFKSRGWPAKLGRYDAVVAMQAVHEVRHKLHVPALLGQIRKLLHPAGRFFICDHFLEGMKKGNPELYMTVKEQRAVLRKAGFEGVKPLLQKGSLALYRASIEARRIE